MGSIDDFSQLCRLCLVKDQVNISIFDESSEIGQTFLKINSCLPVKVSRDDNLPKKICDGCSYKLDMLYIFRNTSVDSEKQLISWLNQAGLSTISQTAMKDPLANTKPEIMVKQETFDSTDSRVDGDHSEIDAQSYLMQQQQLSYQQDFDFGEASGSTELTDEPAPKRAKRAVTLKKAPIEETDETEDDLDAAMQITKAEEEDSDDIDQPDYVEPSTSADDQPGPSGVGKAAVEAPRGCKLLGDEGSFTYKCKTCYEIFATFQEFKYHPRCERPRKYPEKIFVASFSEIGCKQEPKPWQCDICPSDFTLEIQLRRHRLRHFDLQIQCTDCNERFRDAYSLNQHLISEHGKEVPSLSCDICERVFKCVAQMKRHRLRHYKPQVKCIQCDKCFFDEYGLKQHIEFVHDRSKNYICDLCNYSSGSKTTLQRHVIRIHTKAYPFVCELCSKGYTDKRLLEIHQRSVHEGEQFMCEDCGKTYKYLHGLREHRKSHDVNGKRKEAIKCELCGEKFIYLKEHIMKVHAGIKSSVCEICGKGFHGKNALEVHIMRKHKNERPEKCDFCGHCVVTKTELKQHIKRRHLERDSLEDEKDKPFQCNVCEKRFKANASLTDHLRKHAGEKAYICEVCDEKFISKHFLKSHTCTGRFRELQEVSQ